MDLNQVIGQLATPDMGRWQQRHKANPAPKPERGFGLPEVIAALYGANKKVSDFSSDYLKENALFGAFSDKRPQAPTQADMEEEITMRALDAITPMPMGAMVKAFHGTPHAVDKFRMDKIGTGEGAQAYGHGLYFAESPEVAKAYRKDLTANEMYIGENKVYQAPISDDARNFIMQAEGSIDNAIIDAEKALDHFTSVSPSATNRKIAQDAVNELSGIKASGGITKNEGNLYNVELDVDHKDLLDWDAALSDQPQKVRDALGKTDEFKYILEEANTYGFNDPSIRSEISRKYGTGEKIYRTLTKNMGGKKETSEALNSLGIPGIRYFDQVSRTAGEGTRNITMFDEDLIKILSQE